METLVLFLNIQRFPYHTFSISILYSLIRQKELSSFRVFLCVKRIIAIEQWQY